MRAQIERNGKKVYTLVACSLIDTDDYIQLMCGVAEEDARDLVHASKKKRRTIRVSDITWVSLTGEFAEDLRANFENVQIKNVEYLSKYLRKKFNTVSRTFIIFREVTFPIVVNQFLNVPY